MVLPELVSALRALSLGWSKQGLDQSQKAQVATENKVVNLLQHTTAQQGNTHIDTPVIQALEAARIASLQHTLPVHHDHPARPSCW